ncbi:vomeronasal type-2 receptor 26-like [Mantella aurantiaca]
MNLISLDLAEYEFLMAFFFAIDDINKDPHLLPNITLGYHLFDTCGYTTKAIASTIKILAGYNRNAFGVESPEVAGFVGDTFFSTTLAVAEFLNVYQYPQISHRVTDPLLSDRNKFPNFYRTIQTSLVWYQALIRMLKLFRWNWVGIITSNDGTGEMELQELRKGMASHGICIEFVIYLTNDKAKNRKMAMVIVKSTTDVIVLRRYIRRIHYISSKGDMIYLNERGELPSVIYFAKLLYYDLTQGYFKVNVEYFTESNRLELEYTPEDFFVTLEWKRGKVPQARCSVPCPPGYRKALTGGIHACCYHCVSCPDGEISNVTDSDICHKCPDDKWPDKRKVICIPKTYEYLSYEAGVMTQAFYVISILCSALTLYILTLFILFRDTPIVRANNQTVSFILLTAILLSFLCVFLFLGRPVDITCMLRQISFGIFFSIAVSCVLAKTVTVCIAFKASKPGSDWRNLVGEKISNSVVLICSSIQVVICIIWLLVSPPYQEYDLHSYPGKIIIQCNEGSVIGFYSVLGYMGFLAAVSFVLAFMVRTLPDCFNEAKYITFSMLVFCSVWIAMIPAYLSSRGKYMVAVEVFAILASSIGLLGCIFFPKCYIITIKPERNSKKHILYKIKS